MDPQTGKFANGDFSDPLKKPSFVPAQTINLILDNLNNFIQGLGLNPNNTNPNQLLAALQNKYATAADLKSLYWPVGMGYFQYPDTPSPVEAGWPGVWEIWSNRAVEYGIHSTPPPSGFAADFQQYGIERWELKTGGTVGPGGTKKYTRPATGYLYAERQKCGSSLITNDLNTGDRIQSGTHTNMYVWEKLSLAGLFPSIEGGNRPTFVSGGRAPDRQRPMYGQVGWIYSESNPSDYEGVLYWGPYQHDWSMGGDYGTGGNGIRFDNARAVLTGPDNAPVTLSIRFWRRIA
jgi:hypothetical protein